MKWTSWPTLEKFQGPSPAALIWLEVRGGQKTAGFFNVKYSRVYQLLTLTFPKYVWANIRIGRTVGGRGTIDQTFAGKPSEKSMTTHQSQMWLDYFPSSITQFENQWTFGLKILVYFGGSANSHIQPPDHLTWPTTVAFCRTSGGWSFRWTADFGSKTGRVTKINWSSKSASSGHVTPNLGSRLTRRLKRFKRIVKKTPQGWKVFFWKSTH